MRRLALVALLVLLAPAAVATAEPRYRVALVRAGDALETLAARRALQSMGIPFDEVAPAQLDARYPLALLPGPLYNNSLAPEQREAVYGFVSSGGLLVATHVEGSDYFRSSGSAQPSPAATASGSASSVASRTPGSATWTTPRSARSPSATPRSTARPSGPSGTRPRPAARWRGIRAARRPRSSTITTAARPWSWA
jgi:hypothetical protein